MYSDTFTKKEPEKRLIMVLKEHAGRSTSSGRITTRHQGGGVKRFYRIVDFGQQKINLLGKVVAIEYDPYRTSYIILVEYSDGEKRYVLAPKGVKVGDEIICSATAELKSGNRTQLKRIPIGMEVYNVEIEPGRGGKMMRGAGTSAKVMAQEPPYVHLEMPSGETRKISQECFATLGMVSNEKHIFESYKTAGKSRRKGIRPKVRGGAMIPVAHPHGGGNGKTPIGLTHPKTPWGKPARGVRTRTRFWTNKFILTRQKRKDGQ
jgi:large subunit ribosomal protein L2